MVSPQRVTTVGSSYMKRCYYNMHSVLMARHVK
uniref:Uncharacterized protein n=1 Tax=Siphoviridae sp. cttFh17 TaxID=2826491 RepID=A0A8S5NIA8_9CAUD|nr:MAG TPA: hypothetical protein [Siphoviridae sp. cttFh17]DAW08959.1 MAG TPA: hypothetical protein [Caudoviricetes sp.]